MSLLVLCKTQVNSVLGAFPDEIINRQENHSHFGFSLFCPKEPSITALLSPDLSELYDPSLANHTYAHAMLEAHGYSLA